MCRGRDWAEIGGVLGGWPLGRGQKQLSWNVPLRPQKARTVAGHPETSPALRTELVDVSKSSGGSVHPCLTPGQAVRSLLQKQWCHPRSLWHPDTGRAGRERRASGLRRSGGLCLPAQG